MKWSAENMFFCRILKLLPFKDPPLSKLLISAKNEACPLGLELHALTKRKLHQFLT